MNIVDTEHFKLEKLTKVQGTSSKNIASDPSVERYILVVLDLHQTPISHRSFLDKLRQHHTVYTITLRHTVVRSITNWTPSLTNIQQELSLVEEHLPMNSLRGCVGQGIGARILEWFNGARPIDILCSPVFPDTDVAAVKLLAKVLLWRNANHSRWFNQLIESSWREALPQPTNGDAPWIATSLNEQQSLHNRISNGTWKSLFDIIQHPVQFKSNEIHLLLGGQSPNQNLVTLYESLEQDNNVYHRYYPSRRQELLLAECVQRDILHTYLEDR